MLSSPSTMVRRDRWNRYSSEGTFRGRPADGTTFLLPSLILPPAAWMLPLFADIAHEESDERGKACKQRDEYNPGGIHEFALVHLPGGDMRYFIRMPDDAKRTSQNSNTMWIR
jgi:hypothetical protein